MTFWRNIPVINVRFCIFKSLLAPCRRQQVARTLEVEPGIIVCLISDFNVPQIQVTNDPLQVPVSAGFALEVGRAEERVNNGRLAPEHKMKNVNTAFSAFFVRSADG